MTRARTLIFVAVIVVAFAASFTAGRALRPAGAPAAPAAVAKTIAVAEPSVSVPRFDDRGELPPLRVPRPAPPGPDREPAPDVGPGPAPVEPYDAAPPVAPVDPGPAPVPQQPAPPPEPAPQQEPPAPESGGGGWSSGN